MKKLSRQILLGGAIFFVLAIAPFCNFSTFASASEDLPVVTLTRYIPQLKTLAAAKHAAIQEELASLPGEEASKFTICKATLMTALQKAEYLQQFAYNAEKCLNIYNILNDTIISGADLDLSKQQALASERDTEPSLPTRRRLEMQKDQPLVAIVMVFNKNEDPKLRFNTFGRFEYARSFILCTLATAFPDQDLDSMAAETNAWIHNVGDYDLNDATARESEANKELEKLAASPSEASSALTKHWERERDLATLEIEIVDLGRVL